jgi:hypothetical protein
MNEKVRNNRNNSNNSNNVIHFNEECRRSSNLLTLATQIKGYKVNTITREIAGKIVVFYPIFDVFANENLANNDVFTNGCESNNEINMRQDDLPFQIVSSPD